VLLTPCFFAILRFDPVLFDPVLFSWRGAISALELYLLETQENYTREPFSGGLS